MIHQRVIQIATSLPVWLEKEEKKGAHYDVNEKKLLSMFEHVHVSDDDAIYRADNSQIKYHCKKKRINGGVLPAVTMEINHSVH